MEAENSTPPSKLFGERLSDLQVTQTHRFGVLAPTEGLTGLPSAWLLLLMLDWTVAVQSHVELHIPSLF